MQAIPKSSPNNKLYNNSKIDPPKPNDSSSSVSSDQSVDDLKEIKYVQVNSDCKKPSNISKQKTKNTNSQPLPSKTKRDDAINKESKDRKALSEPALSSDLTTMGSRSHQGRSKTNKVTSKDGLSPNHANKPLSKLTENKTYTKLFEVEREYKKGGLFEIYSRKTGTERLKDAHQALKETLEVEDDLFFVNANRSDMAEDILTRNAPNQSELKDKKYLIREKNTLRFANDSEKSYLDEHLKKGILTEEHGEYLEKNSYGRMVMANHRAVKRYDHLRISYGKLIPHPTNTKLTVFDSPVFDFEPAPGFKIIFKGLHTGGEHDQTYGKCYNVTLKDLTLPLKKVFEILQVYCSSHEKDENNTRALYAPLRVGLTIGGKKITFVLSQYTPAGMKSKYQMMVSMKIEGKNEYKGNSYTFSLGDRSGKFGPYGLITKDKTYQSGIAKDMLDCLNSRMDNDINTKGRGLNQWGGLSKKDLEKFIEFMVLTQVVESNIMPNDQNSSRTPGMNKLGRKLLNSIAAGETTFEHAFIHSGGAGKRNIHQDYGYPPIGTGGTDKSREAIKNVTREGAQSHDMSEDSDEVV